jgi:hypothetical protein
LQSHRSTPVSDAEVSALAPAGWPLSREFISLAMMSNILELHEADPAAVVEKINQGVIALGELAKRG